MNLQAAGTISFENALAQTYLEQPCKVLPNALWKTRTRLQELQTSCVLQVDRVSQLVVWNARMVFTYWSRSRVPMDFPYARFVDSDLMLVHQDYISTVNPQDFPDRKSYFRLSYSGAKMPEVPAGWRIREAAPNVETEAIAEFIRQCYPGSKMSPETVQSWESYPVHDPSLWVWVENAAGEAMGLGIAEYDSDIREGSLEWIQVLPAYRRMGVGKILVATLVRRLRQQSVLITVSGEVESESQPGMLYRKCGFVGEDTWWLLRKKQLAS